MTTPATPVEPRIDPVDAAADHEHMWQVGSAECVVWPDCHYQYDGRFDRFLEEEAEAAGVPLLRKAALTILTKASREERLEIEDFDRLRAALAAAAPTVEPKDSAEQWHKVLAADPLLPDCSGTHSMGYGYCQRLAVAQRTEGGAAAGLDVERLRTTYLELGRDHGAGRRHVSMSRSYWRDFAAEYNRLAAAAAAEEEHLVIRDADGTPSISFRVTGSGGKE